MSTVVSGVALSRYTAAQNLTSHVLSRYASPMAITSRLVSRYSGTGDVGGRLLSRYAAGLDQGGSVQFRYSSPGVDYLPSGGGQINALQATVQGLAQPSVLIYIGETQVDPEMYLFELRRARSRAAEYELHVQDPTGEYHPRRVSGGVWTGLFSPNVWGTGGPIPGYTKVLAAQLQSAGAAMTFVGIPLGWGASSRGFAFDLVSRGKDVSERLFRKSVTWPTIRSTPTAPVTNIAAIADIATRLDISIDTTALRVIVIGTQHRQNGKPGNWLQELLDATAAEWSVRGTTVYCYQNQRTSTPVWVYDDTTLVWSDDAQVDASPGKVVNKITVRRASEGHTPSVVASTSPASSTPGKPPNSVYAFGQFSMTFSPPLNNPRVQQLSGDGVLSDLKWYDSGGNLVAVNSARSPGEYPSSIQNKNVYGGAKLTYTWGAPQNYTGTGLPGTFQVTGEASPATVITSPSVTSSKPPAPALQFDPTYTVTVNHADSQTYYGDVFELELQPSPLLTTSADATFVATEMLEQLCYGDAPRKAEVAVNPGLEVGQNITYVDARLQTSETLYIVAITDRYTDTGQATGRSMLDLIRYGTVNGGP